MITLYEPAYAKLNLTLDVVGLRSDGYHDLQSVMQTVALCDDIFIDIGTGMDWELVCSDPAIPADHRNLAWKAARVFFDETGIDPEGIRVRIEKRIPSQAGMGGGSSDAAAVLRALNRHYGNIFTQMDLADLGARIGSDVPFCVVGGTVMCEGRGEKLRPITPITDCVILVCKPEFSMSTPVLYKKLDASVIENHPDNIAMENALKAGDIHAVARNLCNVFDPVVSAEYPLMDEIRRMFMAGGSLGCQMSGSGSAFFGIMPNETAAIELSHTLKTLCDQVFMTKPA